MPPLYQRVHDVPAIELSDGKEVERRGEHADGGRAAYRMEVNIAGACPGKDASFEQPLKQRDTEMNITLMADAGNYLRKRQTDRERWQQKDKASERARYPDVEQGPLGVNGRPDTNKSAKRADQSRRRQKIRQAGVHAVICRCEIMSRFVREQNRDQSQRERQAFEQLHRMMPDPLVHLKKDLPRLDRQVAVEIVLQRDTEQGRGEQRQQKQQTVKPVALFAANPRAEVPVARPGIVRRRVIRVRLR